MSTSLYIITNSKLKGDETSADFDNILSQLKELNLCKTFYEAPKGQLIQEIGDWSYEIEEDNEELEIIYNVSFNGPFSCTPNLYSNIGIIWTIYKYRLIYETQEIYWFDEFRREVFEIVKIMGGSEIIYVADNACDKLSGYLEGMAFNNISYEEIKETMIKEMGQPVKQYEQLDYHKLSYKNINEFFLDDFSDLK